ncbi:hypothetical protein ASZ90_016963 [hydrocarbon metagenome]|uniref:Uncharacterized protein n=1 Tax=hydrocarbon metagenome TaxID=938273 RepID=A0A0W8EAG1_9ZZZZ
MLFIDIIRNVFSRNTVAIISFFYKKIFQEPMNEEVEKFVKILSFVGFGTVLCKEPLMNYKYKRMKISDLRIFIRIMGIISSRRQGGRGI